MEIYFLLINILMGTSKSKAIRKHAKVAFPDSELEVLEAYFELLRCHD